MGARHKETARLSTNSTMNVVPDLEPSGSLLELAVASVELRPARIPGAELP
jgi:hypothetical protein